MPIHGRASAQGTKQMTIPIIRMSRNPICRPSPYPVIRCPRCYFDSTGGFTHSRCIPALHTNWNTGVPPPTVARCGATPKPGWAYPSHLISVRPQNRQIRSNAHPTGVRPGNGWSRSEMRYAAPCRRVPRDLMGSRDRPFHPAMLTIRPETGDDSCLGDGDRQH